MKAESEVLAFQEGSQNGIKLRLPGHKNPIGYAMMQLTMAIADIMLNIAQRCSQPVDMLADMLASNFKRL